MRWKRINLRRIIGMNLSCCLVSAFGYMLDRSLTEELPVWTPVECRLDASSCQSYITSYICCHISIPLLLFCPCICIGMLQHLLWITTLIFCSGMQQQFKNNDQALFLAIEFLYIVVIHPTYSSCWSPDFALGAATLLYTLALRIICRHRS